MLSVAGVMRPIVWCQAGEPVRDVARRIGDAAQSCAVFRVGGCLGIVTDHDFRHRVATGELGVEAAVAGLGTVPALTIDEASSPATALVRMVEHAVHHLVVTDPGGQPVGIVRVVDLTTADVRRPLVVRSAIATAVDLDELCRACTAVPQTLVQLRDGGLDAMHVAAMHAALVEAVVRRVIELRAGPVLTSVAPSWILLGSLARREPLPLSDIDTALLWPDPPASGSDPAEAIRREAGEVLNDLRRCGLRPCANGANADNPLFSRSLSAWVGAARDWMHDPTRDGALLLTAMVADSRPMTNHALGVHLTDTIRSRTRTSQFLRALLDEALGWRPPTGVVRGLVVRHRGEHRGRLDLKRGGLAPVVALGRWIAIATGDATGTTPQRLARGLAAGLLRPDEAATLLGGFEHVHTLLLDHELRAVRTGADPSTFIRPADLDPFTRRHLRETFRAVRSVQTRADQDWIRRLISSLP